MKELKRQPMSTVTTSVTIPIRKVRSAQPLSSGRIPRASGSTDRDRPQLTLKQTALNQGTSSASVFLRLIGDVEPRDDEQGDAEQVKTRRLGCPRCLLHRRAESWTPESDFQPKRRCRPVRFSVGGMLCSSSHPRRDGHAYPYCHARSGGGSRPHRHRKSLMRPLAAGLPDSSASSARSWAGMQPGAHKLTAEPPAKQILGVPRTVDGCARPVTIGPRSDVGAPRR